MNICKVLAPVALITTLAGCAHQTDSRPREGWSSDPTRAVRPSADWIRDDKVPVRYKLTRHPRYVDRIRDAVAEQGKLLQKCYDSELNHDPELYGELSVAFKVAADGQVHDALIDFSSLSSPALEPCVLGVFNGLRLTPPPQPEFSVRYPLVFTTDNTPDEVVDALRERYHLERENAAEARDVHQKKEDKAPW